MITRSAWGGNGSPTTTAAPVRVAPAPPISPPQGNPTPPTAHAGSGPNGPRRQPRPQGDPWPDPFPLPSSLLPVAGFDFDLLPDAVRPWIADAAGRMQCAPEFMAVSAMASLGALIGRKVAIRPKVHDDWAVVGNMWALLVGRPGVLKSPAMEEALRPIRALAAAAQTDFTAAKARHQVAASAATLRQRENTARAAKVLKGNPQADVSDLLAEEDLAEPTLKRYIANDTNVASLGVLLQQNPNGLLVYRDEMVSLLSTLDREEYQTDRGFYLTGWNGNSTYTFDRIGRGLDLTVDGVCISMLGSTQPGKISQYLARAIHGGPGDDGLIQRFGLMVWPDITSDWTHVDRYPDRDARTAARHLFERLDVLDWRRIDAQRDRKPDGDEEGLPYLRFGIEAYDLYRDWHAGLQRRLQSGDLHVALEAHLAKYPKLVTGLALVCHLADHPTGPVDAAAVRRAIAWAAFLESHARRAYGSVTVASADTARAILAKIRSGHLKAEFSSRDVWRPQWSKLTDREAVHAGLAMLADYEWLDRKKVETAGRPAVVYVVNPRGLQP